MFSFNAQLIVAIVLAVIMFDWVVLKKVTPIWLNKLFFIPALYCLYATWVLIHVDEKRTVILGTFMLVYAVAFVLIGLNRLLRRPYHR